MWAQLRLVFDVCELRRIVQRKEEDCGWSDVLETFHITQAERNRRFSLFGSQYCSFFDPQSLPQTIPEPLTDPQKQLVVSLPLNKYLGRPFPSVEFCGSFAESNLVNVLASTSPPWNAQVPGSCIWQVGRVEQLSFNQLPICHFLHEALNRQLSRNRRITCLLAACVLRLMSSKNLEVLFRDRAMLDKSEGDRDRLWSLVEVPKFLQVFLTSAGKHDMACTLFVMLVQWLAAEDRGVPLGDRHEEIRNLDGQRFADFSDLVLPQTHGAEQHLPEVVGWLLSQLMQLARDLFHEALRSTRWVGYHDSCDLTPRDVVSLDAPGMLPFLRSECCLAAKVHSRKSRKGQVFEPEHSVHQVAWRHQLDAESSHLQVCEDTQDIKVKYSLGIDDHVHNPYEAAPLLKTVISRP